MEPMPETVAGVNSVTYVRQPDAQRGVPSEHHPITHSHVTGVNEPELQ